MAEKAKGEEKRKSPILAIEESMPVAVKELVAGGVAGGFAKTAVAPLERVKILFQTRRAEFHSAGLYGSFQKIARTEGLMGFYRGNGASVARIVPYAALHYMAYEEYRRWIILAFPNIGRGPVLDLVSGSIAGGTAVIFTYPLDLVRTKLAYQVVGASMLKGKGLSQPEIIYRGIFDCISKIFKQNGIRGLYRGVVMQGSSTLLLAGATAQYAETSIQAELKAMIVALSQCAHSRLQPRKIYTDCLELIELIERKDLTVSWRMKEDIQHIEGLLEQFPVLEVSYCPRELNNLADALAKHGRSNPQRSLFHRGEDRPRWLENILTKIGMASPMMMV